MLVCSCTMINIVCACVAAGSRLCCLQVLALHEPWDWLLPALCAAGQPVLDPRFNFLIDPAAATPPAALSAPSSAAEDATAGSAEGRRQALAPAPPLPVQMLLGLQPMIGRPPFLGPLVQKLTAVQHVLGGLDWACSSSRTVQQLSTGLKVQAGPWDEQRWMQLFTLLADHPPRDLQPQDVAVLRELPMFRLAAQPQKQQGVGGYGQPAGGSGAAGSSASGGGYEQAAASQLVALGSSTEWVLAPAAVMQACAGRHGCVLDGLQAALTVTGVELCWCIAQPQACAFSPRSAPCCRRFGKGSITHPD